MRVQVEKRYGAAARFFAAWLGVFLAALLLLPIGGCGGGGGASSDPRGRLRFSVTWPALVATRAQAPSFTAPRPARSVKIIFTGLSQIGDFSDVFNRDPRQDEYIATYESSQELDLGQTTGPLGFHTGEATIKLEFWSDRDATGVKVAEWPSGDQKFNIRPAQDARGNRFLEILEGDDPVPTILPVGRIDSVKINEDQVFPIGIAKTVGVIVKAEAAEVALLPGSVEIEVLSGSAEVVPGVLGRIRVTAAGEVRLRARIKISDQEQVVSDPTSIEVRPQVEVKKIQPSTKTEVDGSGETIDVNDTPLTAGESRQFSAAVGFEGLELAPEVLQKELETTAVTWKVVAPSGAATDTTFRDTGLYTAPSSLTEDQDVIIEATSVLQDITPGNKTKSRKLRFRITPTLTIALFDTSNKELDPLIKMPPSVRNAITGEPLPSTRIFTARVSDGTAVNWSVDEENGGTLALDPADANKSDRDVNKIVYTAPERSGTFTLRATSRRDPRVSRAVKVKMDAGTVGVVID